jgi:uncharacterized OB-fold protein
MTPPRIVPEETDLTAPYWSSAAQGRVALQRCQDCGQVWHPAAPSCPGGVGHRIEWFEASGRGTLYSFTVVAHSAHPAVSDALPYIVALIALEEGPLYVCNLLDADPANLRADMPVLLAAGPAAGGLTLPVARIDQSPSIG